MLPWKDNGVSREDWLVEQASLRMYQPSKRRVVEFGSATGEMTAQLLAQGFDVTAVEAREESHKQAECIAPAAHRVLADVEALLPSDVGAPFDLVFHVGVLYHLLGPIEHLIQLRKWGPRLLLDTHYCLGESPVLHRERIHHSRAGLRNSSWWLPLSIIEFKLKSRYGLVEKIDDREERNGPRVTFWAES